METERNEAKAKWDDAYAAGEHWKLSKDPLFVEKVRDIVGLYLDPPERALVLCVDEKSQIQALDRTQPILPMMPGVPSAPLTTISVMARAAYSQR